MGSGIKIVTLLSIACLLVSLFDDEVSAAATFRIVRRGRRTGVPGNFSRPGNSVNSPEFPPIYGALRTPEESSQSQNEVAEQGTTTESTSSEEQQAQQSLEDVGVSEDYIFSTATQTTANGDTTGASSEELNESVDNRGDGTARNSEIADRGFDPKVQTIESPDRNQEDLERSNEIVSSTKAGQQSSYFGSAKGALDQVQVENQDSFQVQTQAPSPVQEPKTTYEQIMALHQPTIYNEQPGRQQFPNPRQGGYGQGRPESSMSRNGQQQLYQLPMTQPQQLYQQPRAQPQQPQQLYQQPQPQPQEQYQQPQQSYQQSAQPPQQLYSQPQQSAQPPQQFYQQPQQQQIRLTEQVPEPSNYYPPRPFQPQQLQSYPNMQPQQNQNSQQYQNEQQRSYQPAPNTQYGSQFSHQPQHHQQQQYQPQGQQPRALYQPPPMDHNNLDQPISRSGNENPRAELRQIPEIDDASVTFEGLNDNVVDAELLERVQQIIEEHERQQKEMQQRLRNAQRERQEAGKDNAIFPGPPPNEFQFPQPNIYTQTNENSSPNTNANIEPRVPPAAFSSGNPEIRNNEEAIPPQLQLRQEPSSPANPPIQGPHSSQPVNIPQPYFPSQEPQTGYSNGPFQNGAEVIGARDGNDRENQGYGRALKENKSIQFQPAILTSHFVESTPRGQTQARNGGGPSAYLPSAQQNSQPLQPQYYQGGQQFGGQNAYVQAQQLSPLPGPEPTYQVTQPQQPEGYFNHPQPQPQNQQVVQGAVFPATNSGGYPDYQPAEPVSQRQDDQERGQNGERNSENSIEYYQRGGYSQPQHVYIVPMSQMHYQQPQQYQNFDDTNSIHSQAQPEIPQRNVIMKTIVIHEQPTSVYSADNNRAIITADDLRGNQPSYPQPQEYSPDQSQQQQPQGQQPQQYQYLTATAQLSLAPESEPSSYQPQNPPGGKDITPPRPIYGVPLAPVLGPDDNLDSRQFHSTSTRPTNYLPPSQPQVAANSIQESSSDHVSSWNPNASTAYGATPIQKGSQTFTAVPFVSNTVSLPTHEYSPSASDSIVEETTPSLALPYGRRIDRHIRKRFSSAVTSPLAGFFSVKTKSS